MERGFFQLLHLQPELLAGMLVIFSQSELLGPNPIVWLYDQEPVKFCQKGPPPAKAKLKRLWTYLSQFRLTVHHIPDKKNDCLTIYRATTSMRFLMRTLRLLPKRLSNALTSS